MSAASDKGRPPLTLLVRVVPELPVACADEARETVCTDAPSVESFREKRCAPTLTADVGDSPRDGGDMGKGSAPTDATSEGTFAMEPISEEA